MPAKKAATKSIKAAPRKTAPKRAAKPAHKKVAKADGDAPVQAWIGLLPEWQAAVVRRVDAVVARSVPGLSKAIKWRSAMYGVPGGGWFLSIGSFKQHVKLVFFDGVRLKPVPPSAGTSPTMRALDVRDGDTLDETQVAAWVKQASQLPGWGSA
jgi:hypothetical protein